MEIQGKEIIKFYYKGEAIKEKYKRGNH